jgi:hypothetical protein
MPKIIKYMPNVVYERKQYLEQPFFELIKSYNGIFEVLLDEAMQSPESLGHNFYGSIFVKIQHQRPTGMVIAIRGTMLNIRDNLETDILSWWKSVFDDNASINLPAHYVHMAGRLCHIALQFARHELDLPASQVFVTGHSLGGAIAALIPAKVKLPVRAVTFNAPGIKEIPGVTDFPYRVMNIRSEYDFVSAIAAPIGPVWNVSVPEEEQAARQAFSIAEDKRKHPYFTRFIGPLGINNLMETEDFILSVQAQHSMLNLWQAMKHTSIESQAYAPFEILLNSLQKQQAVTV